mgnify:CR=1 FL=1
MAMHLIHTIGSIIAAFAEEYLNTFCLGVSRNMRSVSVPFAPEQHYSIRGITIWVNRENA